MIPDFIAFVLLSIKAGLRGATALSYSVFILVIVKLVLTETVGKARPVAW